MKNKALQNTMGHLGEALTKNSPTILTGMSVAGLVTTTVMAVRATPKAMQILDYERDFREDAYENPPEITKMDIIELTWRCYVPAAAMAMATIACTIGANSINLRRNAALASVYSLTETAFKEYQAKVIETIGETKEKKVKDEIAKDRIKANPVGKQEIFLTGKGDMLCYDVISGRYFKSDVEKIRKIQNDLNRDLINDMFISLNDVYYALGLSNTKMGNDVGWTIGDGHIDFNFSSQLAEDGTPCLVVDYAVGPRYDYRENY